MSNWLKSNWIIVAILLIAAFFRFWQITSLPNGLFPDEAAYGMDGRSITQGDFQPFFERGNGREGLFMYFLALAISIFGYAPWVNHLVSASFGLAAVVMTYLLTKKIFDQKTAYLASFFIAISSYAVTMTRTAFRANTIPFFTTITLYFAIKAFTDDNSKSQVRSAALAGLFFSLGFYTYISYRMMLPLIFGFWLVLIFANRHQLLAKWNEYKHRIIAFKIAMLAAISWIAYYWFVSHPGSFIGRAGQVSIFSPDLNNGDVLGTFIEVFKKTILSYFTEGDLNWRHNVAGYPFLSPLISPFFAIALLGFTIAIFTLLKQ
ncbi:MAG TPA: glycosyltransferase family 39 protein, partial [Verrucomicrobiae bacterium]|nr:glycosyltransferase family 39 protein [Verrucomicrobiae bacterium]